MLTTLTTVGYGDFKPVSTNERIFIIFVLLFGVAYFAVVMGSFNSAIADFDSLESGGDLLAELNIWISSIEKLYGPVRSDIK
jgi:hypothetical protein